MAAADDGDRGAAAATASRCARRHRSRAPGPRRPSRRGSATASAIRPLVARPTAVGPPRAHDRDRTRASSAAASPATYSTGGGSSIATQARRVVRVGQRHRANARTVEGRERRPRIARPRPRRPRRRPGERVGEPSSIPAEAATRAVAPRGCRAASSTRAGLAERGDQPGERHRPDARGRCRARPTRPARRSRGDPCGPSPVVDRRRRPKRSRSAPRRRPRRSTWRHAPERPTPSISRPPAWSAASTGARKRAASSRWSIADGLRAREVRDRPRDAQQPLGPAAGQPLALRQLDRRAAVDRHRGGRPPAAPGPRTRPFERRPAAPCWRRRAARDARRDRRGRLGRAAADQGRGRHPVDVTHRSIRSRSGPETRRRYRSGRPAGSGTRGRAAPS